MGLFRRKTAPRADLPTSGHTGDDQVLAQLASLGTDLETPRLWEHFVYCDDEAGASLLAQRAVEAGWTVEHVVPEYHGIVARRGDQPVNPQTVAEARAFFESIAAAVPGGDYDGWGAQGD